MGPPGTERNWLTADEREAEVWWERMRMRTGGLLLFPLDRLQWVGRSLEVSKINPVSIIELVFRVGAAMNATAVA